MLLMVKPRSNSPIRSRTCRDRDVETRSFSPASNTSLGYDLHPPVRTALVNADRRHGSVSPWQQAASPFCFPPSLIPSPVSLQSVKSSLSGTLSFSASSPSRSCTASLGSLVPSVALSPIRPKACSCRHASCHARPSSPAQPSTASRPHGPGSSQPSKSSSGSILPSPSSAVSSSTSFSSARLDSKSKT